MASRSIKNRPDIKKKHPFTGFLVACTIIIALIATGVIGVYALGSSWLEDLPDYSDVTEYNNARPTELYANDGTTRLAEFYIENREPVILDQISPYVTNGTIATEDERYYEHEGIDLWGVGRALMVNLTGSSREGASTITQQFVRATVLSEEASDISLKRKVREMYISLKLEEMYSKDEILLMYLNTINYGQGAYGIEAASKAYFSKPATDLTIAEAAILIGIPQSPTYNNPVDNPDNCLQRRNHVLGRMLSNGYITQEEYDAAVAEPITLNREVKPGNGIYLYPYFTTYVRDTIIEQFGEAEVFKGGLKVYTTIDPGVQEAAEAAARNKEATLDDDIEVAMTAIDPNTGFIKAMVGGKDFYASQFNLATQAERSPGSAFKTFTLLTALEAEIAPTTSISCSSRVQLGTWNPENYGGTEYGTKTISGAFEVSSNTAFARLITALTPEKVAEMAHRIGIESDFDALPSITLGSVGVNTTEMANAYATVANGGTHHEATGIEKIIDRNGATIHQADTTGERALSPEIAHAATEVMKGVVARGTGTLAALPNGQPVAGKTGTSEDWEDSYFVGTTPQISVAIWLGAREPHRTMPESWTATSVFRDFVGTILAGQPIQDFPTAADPKYTPYSNATLSIGSGYVSGNNNNNSNSNNSNNAETDAQKKADEEAKKKADEEAKKNTPTPTPEPKPETKPETKPEPPGNSDSSSGGSP